MTVAEETPKLVESLPPEKAETVLEFARFLAHKIAEADGEWGRLLDSAHEGPQISRVRR